MGTLVGFAFGYVLGAKVLSGIGICARPGLGFAGRA
jgi:hypothetical protein